MPKAVASFVLIVVALAVPAVSQAQGAYVYVGPYGYGYGYYRPVVQPVVPVTQYVLPVPVQLQRPWGIGLRASVAGINQTIGGEENVMSGGGIFTRFRHSRYWGFEIGLDGSHGDWGGGRFQRSSFIPTASVLFHMTPRGPFDLFLIGGVGGVFSSIEVQNPPGHPEMDVGRQKIGEFQAHIGIGAELRLGRAFGIVTDVRYIGRVLDTSSQDGRWYKHVDDGVVPTTSQGVQGTLGLMLHF